MSITSITTRNGQVVEIEKRAGLTKNGFFLIGLGVTALMVVSIFYFPMVLGIKLSVVTSLIMSAIATFTVPIIFIASAFVGSDD